MATGRPPDVHRQRMTRTWVPGASPSAQQMSCGTGRRDTCRAWHTMTLPMGSTVVLSPATPSIGIWYSAGLARYSCPSGSLRSSARRESSSTATSISARLTLKRRASALRRGSFQPGSRCTSAAAIRSASTPAAEPWPSAAGRPVSPLPLCAAAPLRPLSRPWVQARQSFAALRQGVVNRNVSSASAVCAVARRDEAAGRAGGGGPDRQRARERHPPALRKPLWCALTWYRAVDATGVDGTERVQAAAGSGRRVGFIVRQPR